MNVAEDAENALDPRIQIELENLNNATDNINKLETELDEAHTAFRQLLSETTRRLKEITDKLGTSCIEKARYYYEALEMARQAQVQCQQQAQLFQRASEIHNAAKETVALAEARFMSHQHEWNFDQAWQDMLNHATIKVMDAENQKAECGREHHRRAMLFNEAKKKLLQLEEKHRRSIIKARPYFEIKAHCDQMMATQRERVEHLQQTVKEAKRNYATSLRTLEEISNQIHQQRRDYDIVVNGPREPGVGAELNNLDICQKHGNKFNNSDSCKISLIKYKESGNNEKLYNIEKDEGRLSTKEDTEKLDKRSVDGSESKSTQWELELQASMERLNHLSIKDSLYIKQRDNMLSSIDMQNADEIETTAGACCDFSSAGQSNVHNLNQTAKSIMDSAIFEKNVSIDESPHLQRLRSTINSMTVPRVSSKVAIKNNSSKSLNNSPLRRSTSNLEIENVTEKAESKNISRYVPNEIPQIEIKSQRTQSTWNISSSNDSDIDVTNKDNKNDILANDSAQFTNLPYAQTSLNVRLLPAEPSLLEGHYSSSTSSQDDAALLSSRFDRNILKKSASCSANSSPVKLKNSMMLFAKSSNSEITGHEQSDPRNFAIGNVNIKELPLLSLFGRTTDLLAIKGKSYSMIDLNGKQNLKTLLDKSRLGDIQAVSAERLANIRHKLVNDYSDSKIDDVKN